ncbi:ricin B lectin domain-containing protein [Mycena polygramma]|nr:ricin B lectin domain-containing protein [Mycena polygramma]
MISISFIMSLRNIVSLLSVCCLSLYANAQLAGQTVLFQSLLSPSEPGNCLTATSNADGAAVVIKACGTNATQLNSWVVPNGAGVSGPIQIFGDKCLDVTNGANTDGTKLQIWTCASGNTNQLWTSSGSADATITWTGQNKCLDVTNGDITDGNPIQIWDCDSTNDNQEWNAIAVTEPTSFVISLKKNPSLCIAASANAVNASVVIEPCSPGSASQTWSDPTNDWHVAIFDNLCLSTAGNVQVNDGTKLVLQPCVANNGAQEWSHQTGLINNRAFAQLVIDLTNGDETPGNQLQTWEAYIFTGPGDDTNQDWIVTETF